MPSTPPRYQFTGTNAQEAKNLLEAAMDLLDAHMKLLAPGDAMVRYELRERTPVKLTIHLDLGDAITAANEVAALNEAVHLDLGGLDLGGLDLGDADTNPDQH